MLHTFLIYMMVIIRYNIIKNDVIGRGKRRRGGGNRTTHSFTTIRTTVTFLHHHFLTNRTWPLMAEFLTPMTSTVEHLITHVITLKPVNATGATHRLGGLATITRLRPHQITRRTPTRVTNQCTAVWAVHITPPLPTRLPTATRNEQQIYSWIACFTAVAVIRYRAGNWVGTLATRTVKRTECTR